MSQWIRRRHSERRRLDNSMTCRGILHKIDHTDFKVQLDFSRALAYCSLQLVSGVCLLACHVCFFFQHHRTLLCSLRTPADALVVVALSGISTLLPLSFINIATICSVVAPVSCQSGGMDHMARPPREGRGDRPPLVSAAWTRSAGLLLGPRMYMLQYIKSLSTLPMSL